MKSIAIGTDTVKIYQLFRQLAQRMGLPYHETKTTDPDYLEDFYLAKAIEAEKEMPLVSKAAVLKELSKASC